MHRPNEQQQRLSSWAINYKVIGYKTAIEVLLQGRGRGLLQANGSRLRWQTLLRRVYGRRDSAGEGKRNFRWPNVSFHININKGRVIKQGNYSLRRPPKLIIPQIFIEQRWATVYRFMCKQICISNKANMTRALMRVQFWVNSQYSPRTEPTERPIFAQN